MYITQLLSTTEISHLIKVKINLDVVLLYFEDVIVYDVHVLDDFDKEF